MFYNAGHLKTFHTEKKTLLTFDEENPEDPILKSLIAKGWKAPKPRMSTGFAPYKRWYKCKHCKCECQPADKRCECPCSKHQSKNCPKKPNTDSDIPASSLIAQFPGVDQSHSLSSSGSINRVLIVSDPQDETSRAQELTKFLYSSSDKFNFEVKTNTDEEFSQVNFTLNSMPAPVLQASNHVKTTTKPAIEMFSIS